MNKNAKLLLNNIGLIGADEFAMALNQVFLHDSQIKAEIFESLAEYMDEEDFADFASYFSSLCLEAALEEQCELGDIAIRYIEENPNDFILIEKGNKMNCQNKFRNQRISALREILGVNDFASKEEMQEQFDELLKYVR